MTIFTLLSLLACTFAFRGTFSAVSIQSTEVNTAPNGTADPGTNGQIIFDIDDAPGQPDGSYIWTFAPTNSLTVAQIVDAIKNGRIYINVHSARYPSGEIRGHYRRVNGSSTFTSPSAPPPLPSGTPTPNDAARFLTQTTYGPTQTAISQLPSQGFSAWMNSQFTTAATSHLAYLDSAAANPSQLADQLTLLLMSGQMSPAMKTIIVNAISALPASDPIGRVRAAVRLVVTSLAFVIQK